MLPIFSNTNKLPRVNEQLYLPVLHSLFRVEEAAITFSYLVTLILKLFPNYTFNLAI